MFCSNCGAERDAGKFCAACGSEAGAADLEADRRRDHKGLIALGLIGVVIAGGAYFVISDSKRQEVKDCIAAKQEAQATLERIDRSVGGDSFEGDRYGDLKQECEDGS